MLSQATIGHMSHGSKTRARAIREYYRLRRASITARALADNPRCSIDMVYRLHDESREFARQATEIRSIHNL